MSYVYQHMKHLAITINGVLRDLEAQFDKMYRKAFIKNDSLVGMDENFNAVETEASEEEWEILEKKEKELITYPIDSNDLKNHYKFKSEFDFYNFINEDYNFQILGAAHPYQKSFDYLLRIQSFGESNGLFDTTMISKENGKSITSTMHFLAKSASRIRNIKFTNDYENVWNNYDIIVTDQPDILDSKPKDSNKISIKINKLYNQWNPSDYAFDSLQELSDKEFLMNLFQLALQ